MSKIHQQNELLDKQRIAASFSRCAGSYDGVAQLQRDIGHRLLDQVIASGPRCIMDLGSGTGYFSAQLANRFPSAQLISLDLACGMLSYAREHRPLANGHWLCADAESLPLATNSVDLLFSSLVVQWCEHPDQLFAEISRVLKPGAEAWIATLGPRTLYELRDSWAEVDAFTHVNRFQPLSFLQQNLPASLNLVASLQQDEVLEYQQLRQLTDELKKLGAHNMNQGQANGLTGRARIKALRQAYEQYRTDRGVLPATYEVYYLHLRSN